MVPSVMTVMEAVCLLLGETMDWDTAKVVLGRSTFMSELINYDKENVPPAVLKKLKKYIDDPMMAVEAVGRVSSAAKTLATSSASISFSSARSATEVLVVCVIAPPSSSCVTISLVTVLTTSGPVTNI